MSPQLLLRKYVARRVKLGFHLHSDSGYRRYSSNIINVQTISNTKYVQVNNYNVVTIIIIVLNVCMI